MASTERLLMAQGTRCQLGLDGLYIKEQAMPVVWNQEAENSYYCLPTPPNPADAGDSIDYKDILNCVKVDDNTYRVNFVVKQDKGIALNTLAVTIDDIRVDQLKSSGGYDDYIMKKAYPHQPINGSLLVIINPFSGQGKALEIFHKEIKPVLEAAGVEVVLQETKYRNHAADMARTLDIQKYDVVACVSGDGIPHEVINGFYAREDMGVEAFNKVAVTQLPGGSGNALTLSTHGSNDALLATFNMLKAKRTKLDLMAVKQLDSDNTTEKISLSFLSQCYGAIADSDIGTEHLRWMGPIRFDLGVAHKVFTKASYPCDLFIKYLTTTKQELLSHFEEHNDKTATDIPVTKDRLTLSGPKLSDPVPSDWIQVDSRISSKLSIFYTGNMPYVSSDTQFFPAALPNDGSMDLIITSNSTPIAKSVASLLAVASGKHALEDHVLHHKISGYRLVPQIPDNSKHYISIDGEDFPFKTLQVEVLPGILTSLLNEGNYVPTCLKK